ncbi:MAG TPA: hypothetical protein VFV38_08810 [Ktedonobacteraceae bacterium]|nr:hypothetical protein [Ktedonobacteraceae bacterium]
MKDTIRKGATGSAALATVTLVVDGCMIALTLATGGILVPWLSAVLPWLLGQMLNHLHHDLWLFLCLMLLLLLYIIFGITYLSQALSEVSLKTAKECWKEFGAAMVGSTVFLGVILFICEWIFQVHVTLGFIATARLGAFPDLIFYTRHFNRTLAFVWLCYYMTIHLLCLLRIRMTSASHIKIPLSYPATEGRREKYMQQCYQRLTNALRAWDPPPYQSIKLPEFAYYQGKGPLLWKGSTLLISEWFLDPAQGEIFLPALARQIAYFNGPEKGLTLLMNSYPRSIGHMIFNAVTGNWLWFPALISEDWWEHWQHEQVLDVDAFVHAAGQSAWLLHDLRRQYYEIQRAGTIDTSRPTLLERIDHLEMLTDKEATQMKNQNINPAPAQLSPGQATTTRQLKQGNKQK